MTHARVPGQAPNLLDIVTATVRRRSRRQTYDPASSLPQGEVSRPPTRRRDPHATRHTIPVRTNGEWVRQRESGTNNSEVRETSSIWLEGTNKFCDFDASLWLLSLVDETWSARSTQNRGGGVQTRFAISMLPSEYSRCHRNRVAPCRLYQDAPESFRSRKVPFRPNFTIHGEVRSRNEDPPSFGRNLSGYSFSRRKSTTSGGAERNHKVPPHGNPSVAAGSVQQQIVMIPFETPASRMCTRSTGRASDNGCR